MTDWDQMLKWCENYNNMYGSLWVVTTHSGKDWLCERTFAAIEVEWTDCYGPLDSGQIAQLSQLNIRRWGNW